MLTSAYADECIALSMLTSATFWLLAILTTQRNVRYTEQVKFVEHNVKYLRYSESGNDLKEMLRISQGIAETLCSLYTGLRGQNVRDISLAGV